MNTIYNQIQSQPDLQDILSYLKIPLKKLEIIDQQLTSFSAKQKESIDISELFKKVTKLKNKHLIKVINNYCKLDLEYRNTVIIKEYQNNNELIKYTSKDILLQSLGKLIEEIEILYNDFNKYYNNGLAINSLTQELNNGIEINNSSLKNLEYNNVTEIEIIEDKKISIKDEVFVKEENQSTLLQEIDYFLRSPLGPLFLLLCFYIVSTLMVYTLYNKVQLKNVTHITEKIITDMLVGAPKEYPRKNYNGLNESLLYKKGHMHNAYIENGHYITPFGGKISISATTIDKKDDSFIIEAQLLPEKSCNQIATNLQAKHPKLMKINDKVVIQDGFIDTSKVQQACSLEYNNIKIINH